MFYSIYKERHGRIRLVEGMLLIVVKCINVPIPKGFGTSRFSMLEDYNNNILSQLEGEWCSKT